MAGQEKRLGKSPVSLPHLLKCLSLPTREVDWAPFLEETTDLQKLFCVCVCVCGGGSWLRGERAKHQTHPDLHVKPNTTPKTSVRTM